MKRSTHRQTLLSNFASPDRPRTTAVEIQCLPKYGVPPRSSLLECPAVVWGVEGPVPRQNTIRYQLSANPRVLTVKSSPHSQRITFWRGTGLEVVRQLGRKDGRKRQMTESKIKSAKNLLASGGPPTDVASNLSVSVPTPYRWIPASTQS